MIAKNQKIIVISGKSMHVHLESVTHLVVKLFNVNRNFRKIDARPSGIGYTFSSQTLQCEVKI